MGDDEKFKVYLTFKDEATNKFVAANKAMTDSAKKMGIALKTVGKGTQLDLEKMGQSHEKAGRKARMQGRSIAALEGAIGSLRNKLLVYFFIMRPVMKIVGDLTAAAMTQENAEIRLASAFHATGKATEGSAERLQDYASELQKLTGYGDDQIIASQGMLASFGLTEAQIRKATPALLDLNAGTRKADGSTKDLTATARILGQAFDGQVSTLQRSGVNLSETTKKYGEFDDILKDIKRSVGGTAEALGATFKGTVDITNQSVGDFKESLGFIITKSPVVASALGMIGDSFNEMQGSVEDATESSNGFYSVWLKIGAGMIGIITTIRAVWMTFMISMHVFLAGVASSFASLANNAAHFIEMLAKVAEFIPGLKNQAEALMDASERAKEFGTTMGFMAENSQESVKQMGKEILNLGEDAIDSYAKLEAGAKKNEAARKKRILAISEEGKQSEQSILELIGATQSMLSDFTIGSRDMLKDGFVNAVKGDMQGLSDAVVAFGDKMLASIMEVIANIIIMNTLKSAGAGGFLGFSHTGGAVREGMAYGMRPRQKFHNGGEVPATLLSGEYVLNRQATRTIGVGNLDKLNNGQSSVGGNGGGNTYNINTIDVKSFREHLQRHGDIYTSASERGIRDNLSLRRTSQKLG